MTADGLVLWLDKSLLHGEIGQEDMQLYLLSVIEKLRRERELTLEQLSSERYRLHDAIIKKVKTYKQEATSVGFHSRYFLMMLPSR